MSPMRQAEIDLSAVAAALAELGADTASMSALAGRAGVAKPTLYARFRSRDELLRACVDTEAERLLDRLEIEPPAEALADYLDSCPGWRLLLRSDHATAAGARGRLAARLGALVTGAPGLAPVEAAAAFLAAAAALAERRPEPRQGLRTLAVRLLEP